MVAWPVKSFTTAQQKETLSKNASGRYVWKHSSGNHGLYDSSLQCRNLAGNLFLPDHRDFEISGKYYCLPWLNQCSLVEINNLFVQNHICIYLGTVSFPPLPRETVNSFWWEFQLPLGQVEIIYVRCAFYGTDSCNANGDAWYTVPVSLLNCTPVHSAVQMSYQVQECNLCTFNKMLLEGTEGMGSMVFLHCLHIHTSVEE